MEEDKLNIPKKYYILLIGILTMTFVLGMVLQNVMLKPKLNMDSSGLQENIPWTVKEFLTGREFDNFINGMDGRIEVDSERSTIYYFDEGNQSIAFRDIEGFEKNISDDQVQKIILYYR